MAAAQALMTKFFRPTDPTKPYWMTLFEKEEAERKVRTRDRLGVRSLASGAISRALCRCAASNTSLSCVLCVFDGAVVLARPLIFLTVIFSCGPSRFQSLGPVRPYI